MFGEMGHLQQSHMHLMQTLKFLRKTYSQRLTMCTKKKKKKKKIDKVLSGAHFTEHKVCSFDSGDGSCMLYVITLKEFNHT